MCRWIFGNGVIWKSPSQLEMWNLCFPLSSGVILSDYAHPTHVQTIIITHWGNLRVFKHLPLSSPLLSAGLPARTQAAPGMTEGEESPELVLQLTYELMLNISLMTCGSLAQRCVCPTRRGDRKCPHNYIIQTQNTNITNSTAPAPAPPH